MYLSFLVSLLVASILPRVLIGCIHPSSCPYWLTPSFLVSLLADAILPRVLIGCSMFISFVLPLLAAPILTRALIGCSYFYGLVAIHKLRLPIFSHVLIGFWRFYLISSLAYFCRLQVGSQTTMELLKSLSIKNNFRYHKDRTQKVETIKLSRSEEVIHQSHYFTII